MELHGSTQMTLHNAGDVQAAEELGLRRVVLARELGLSDIAQISRRTSLELEVFVHGALCICYSGQCLLSSNRRPQRQPGPLRPALPAAL